MRKLALSGVMLALMLTMTPLVSARCVDEARCPPQPAHTATPLSQPINQPPAAAPTAEPAPAEPAPRPMFVSRTRIFTIWGDELITLTAYDAPDGNIEVTMSDAYHFANQSGWHFSLAKYANDTEVIMVDDCSFFKDPSEILQMSCAGVNVTVTPG